MGNESNQYQGKPIAYLDQNILDLFVDVGHKEFAENLKSSFQIVYSDETLKEIKRSGDYADTFLTVLRDLDAYYLKLVLEQPEFKETDKATLTNIDPFDAFREYCENTKEYDYIQSSMERWLFKYSGGLNGVGISEIHVDQKEAFSKLMNELRAQLQEFSDENPDIEFLFDECENEMTAKLEGALDETERLLKENIPDDKNWSGIKDFRNATKLGPKELNNIKPPDVLKKILEKYKSQPPYNAMDIGIEDFFGMNQHNPIFPDRPHFKHQKITGIQIKGSYSLIFLFRFVICKRARFYLLFMCLQPLVFFVVCHVMCVHTVTPNQLLCGSLQRANEMSFISCASY